MSAFIPCKDCRNSMVCAQLGECEIHGVTGVESRVCADIAARQRLGIAKYGVTVEQSGDDMLTHAYQEALDLSVYLRAEIERKGDLERKLAEARVALEKIAGMHPFNDNSIEIRTAREALARIDAKGKETA